MQPINWNQITVLGAADDTIPARMARDTFFLLIAIALAVPLSVIANLLTPRLRDGWSQRSKKRLQERISQLERELTDPLPPLREIFLSVVRDLAWGLAFLTFFLTMVASIDIALAYSEKDMYVLFTMLVIVLVSYIGTLIPFMRAAASVRGYLRNLPNSAEQDRISNRIEHLKASLMKRK